MPDGSRPRVTALVFAIAVVVAQAAASQAAGPGRTVSLNGIEMYYEEDGQGPPLLLLHWFGDCGLAWQPHRSRLAQHYRLIIPDLRGHGRSTNPAGGFTHREAAVDVFALLDTLGIERTQAMGMSSGGMTLLHMATQQPERIEAMVLIGATTYFPPQARAIFRRSDPDSMSEAELEEWRRCSIRGDAQTREILSQFRQWQHSYDDMNFTEPYLSTITARTLVVHGDRDEFFPVSIPFGMYRAIPRSYLWIVPAGGHIPIFGERAHDFQDEALRFLAGGWERP